MSKADLAIKWILDNADNLDLNVGEYDWGAPFTPDIKDCSVKITLDGVVYEGRGTSKTEEVALLKAFNEAVDRFVFFKSDFQTTNGFAVHLSPNEAEYAAKCEVVERDRFFCHFLTNSNFFESTIRLEDLAVDKKVYPFLKKSGVQIQLSEMRSTKDCRSFIFIGHGLDAEIPFGLSIGMGTDKNPIAAANSALIEGLRHIIGYTNNPDRKNISLEEFLKKDKFFPETQMELANNIEYAKSVIPFFFKQDPKDLNKPESISLDDIKCAAIQLPKELQGAPIYAAKADSSSMQDIYFGPTKIENLNIKRISEFIGREITWDQINKTPHPMG